MNELTVSNETATSLLLNTAAMDSFFRCAKMMASSTVTIPKHLQNREADCFAIVLQSAQWAMNPFAVAQKTHVVNGVLGYEAQLVNAVVQSSRAINGAFNYEYLGDGESFKCRVGAILRGATEITWGQWLDVSKVITKNSPLWKTNPRQQLGYLQVKNWARAYCPGAILGVYTIDELEVVSAPTEKNMGEILRNKSENSGGSAQELQKPNYTAEKFAELLPAWRKAIDSGKKTADEIIAMAKTKASLCAAQEEQIRASTRLEKPVADTVFSYAEIADQIHKAKTLEELSESSDLIRTFEPAEQMIELAALYDTKKLGLLK